MTSAVATYEEHGALDASYSAAEMARNLAETKAKLGVTQSFFRDVMVEGQDYGVIPGTDKPALLKPGAEKLCELYGFAITVKHVDEDRDVESGFFRARVTVALVSKKSGEVIAEGVGEANTHESRYRWRNGQRKCPKCGAEAIIKGKAEYGGGFVCFKKKGGCNAKFSDGDEAIESQVAGKVLNDDPWSQWNTITKMGKKRALVDAALSATRSSGLFSQDPDAFEKWVAEGEPIEGEFTERPAKAARPPVRQPQSRSARREQSEPPFGVDEDTGEVKPPDAISAFWAWARSQTPKWEREDVLKIAGVNVEELVKYDVAALEDLKANLAARREGQAALV